MFSRIRRTIICLCLCFYFAICICESEGINTAITQNNTSDGMLGSDSFAWTDEFLFIAHGYWYTDPEIENPSDQEDVRFWTAPHYSLTRVDIHNGVANTLCKDIHACMMHLLIDDQAQRLYSVWRPNELGPYDNEECCRLTTMDYDGNILEMDEIHVDDYVVDYLLYNDKLYLLGIHGIYAWEIANKKLSCIYVLQNEINNNMYRAHCFAEDSTLYFQEGNSLLSIDLNTYKTEICTFHLDESDDFSRQRYRYIMLGNDIYFNDIDSLDGQGGTLCKIDINDKQTTRRVSENQYCFRQANEDGVLAYYVYGEEYSLWYYPYNNKADLSFDPENENKRQMDNGAILIVNNKYCVVNNYKVYEMDFPDIAPSVPIYDLE